MRVALLLVLLLVAGCVTPLSTETERTPSSAPVPSEEGKSVAFECAKGTSATYCPALFADDLRSRLPRVAVDPRDAKHKMLAWVSDKAPTGIAELDATGWQVHVAESTDGGVNWKRLPDPVIPPMTRGIRPYATLVFGMRILFTAGGGLVLALDVEQEQPWAQALLWLETSDGQVWSPAQEFADAGSPEGLAEVGDWLWLLTWDGKYELRVRPASGGNWTRLTAAGDSGECAAWTLPATLQGGYYALCETTTRTQSGGITYIRPANVSLVQIDPARATWWERVQVTADLCGPMALLALADGGFDAEIGCQENVGKTLVNGFAEHSYRLVPENGSWGVRQQKGVAALDGIETSNGIVVANFARDETGLGHTCIFVQFRDALVPEILRNRLVYVAYDGDADRIVLSQTLDDRPAMVEEPTGVGWLPWVYGETAEYYARGDVGDCAVAAAGHGAATTWITPAGIGVQGITSASGGE